MKFEFKWVAIIFSIHLVWHILEKVLGLYEENAAYGQYTGFIFVLVLAFIMYLMVLDLKKRNRGYLNRRHGLLSGLFISLILVVLAPIMVFILSFIIEPGYFDQMVALSVEAREYSATEAAAEEYNYWSFVKLYMAIYLIVGSLSAAIWSYRLHKMPDPVTD